MALLAKDNTTIIPDITGDATSVRFAALLNLANMKDMAARSRLAAEITELMDIDLTPREIAIAGEILAHIIRQVEHDIRCEIATRIATWQEAPHELILFLARDDIPVARPVLMFSNALNDQDLLAIIADMNQDYAQTIATRSNLSENVCNRLVQTRHNETILRLLNNHNTRLSNSIMMQIANLARVQENLSAPFLKRDEMNEDIALKIYVFVSAQLRQYIVGRFQVSSEKLDRAFEQTLQAVMVRTSNPADITPEILQLADALKEADSLYPRTLIQALQRGRLGLFTALFARFADLHPDRARQILVEEGGKPLAVACKALGITKPEFTSIFLYCRAGRSTEQNADSKELAKILHFFDNIAVIGAKETLQKWRG